MRFLPFITVFAASLSTTSAQRPSTSIESCLGYSVGKVTESALGLQADLDILGGGCQIYGPDVKKLKLVVEYEAETRLRVLIQDQEGLRYQVPDDVVPRPGPSTKTLPFTSQLSFEFNYDPFSFKVLRKSTGEVLFDTTGTTLIFERQYLRLKSWLPADPNLYGLGEHSDSFRIPNTGYTRTLWNRDSALIPERENLYGSHPIYFEHRLTGTHGVFLRSSNGMDIQLDRDSEGRNYIEYSVIGGVFEWYFLAGPEPAEVAKQYAEVVGKPAMVPYWSLGFHQCKYGYQDWFEVAEVVYNHSQAGIPLETMWTDIDYMDHRRVFTVDPLRFPMNKMRDLVQYLRNRHQRYILMVDPAVAEYDHSAYNKGVEKNAFISHNDSKPFRGVVWPGVTVFPDWLHPNTTDYWVDVFLETFNARTGVDIDGVWIDMNEPTSMCRFPCDNPDEQARGLPPAAPPVRDPPREIPGFPSSTPETTTQEFMNAVPDAQVSFKGLKQEDNVQKQSTGVDHEGDDLLEPPYRIGNYARTGLSDLSVHTNLQHGNGLWTYDTHNLYGLLMGMATRAAVLAKRPGLRPFIITRSSFAGSGRYVSKWLGDNGSRWDHYRVQIAQMLSFASIYQIPMVGSDVCGFNLETNEQLCSRWATLGAFNPFYRNHADITSPSQEFYLWPSVTKAARYAINIRYRLLDYIYTALARQSTDGTPTLNPMWYLYPQDNNTFPIELQFFYGDCILVSPVTEEGSTSVKVYLPDDLFYDWETLEPIRGRGEWVELYNVAYDKIPLHIRGGCIVPLRTESANTTTELRKKGFELLVAPGLDGKARGSLYMDDGVSLDGGSCKSETLFEYAGGKLSTMYSTGDQTTSCKSKDTGLRIEKTTILGGKESDLMDEL